MLDKGYRITSSFVDNDGWRAILVKDFVDRVSGVPITKNIIPMYINSDIDISLDDLNSGELDIVNSTMLPGFNDNTDLVDYEIKKVYLVSAKMDLSTIYGIDVTEELTNNRLTENHGIINRPYDVSADLTYSTVAYNYMKEGGESYRFTDDIIMRIVDNKLKISSCNQFVKSIRIGGLVWYYQ